MTCSSYAIEACVFVLHSIACILSAPLHSMHTCTLTSHAHMCPGTTHAHMHPYIACTHASWYNSCCLHTYPHMLLYPPPPLPHTHTYTLSQLFRRVAAALPGMESAQEKQNRDDCIHYLGRRRAWSVGPRRVGGCGRWVPGEWGGMVGGSQESGRVWSVGLVVGRELSDAMFPPSLSLMISKLHHVQYLWSGGAALYSLVPTSHEEKWSGEPSRISWALLRQCISTFKTFCGQPTQKKYGYRMEIDEHILLL